MKEEIFSSGRMNPMIDPTLHIWHWHIPVYLFLGGLAAGILFFAALYHILGREDEMKTAVKIAPFLVPFILVIGLAALFLDLSHKPYFWRLYTTVRFQSPMSWGAWVLMFITPVSIIWCALHINVLLPAWEWKNKWLKTGEEFLQKYKTLLAWLMLIAAVILGVYTGILFSAFNARPLWNTSILGPLFLASGLSAGAAVIFIMSKSHKEKLLFTRIDLIIIGIELFLIVHLFMGLLASTQVQIDAARLFLGGPYTASFWIFVVIIGMLIPAALEILELRGKKIPGLIPAVLVLLGSLMFRFIFTYAGQFSAWHY